MRNITFCLLILYGFTSQAQLVIDNTEYTPKQLLDSILVDTSLVALNVKFNGTTANANTIKLQAAQFSTNFNPTNLGFDPFKQGIILATGNAQMAYGPNNQGGKSMPVTPTYAGDANLAALTTNTVVNSAVLEFDFVAKGEEMTFDYVFASEEYPEYANTGFNDVFGFFLTGPNPDNASVPYNALNIAIVPVPLTIPPTPPLNPPVPITINNVNNGQANSGPCEYCQYYVNNGTGATPAANPHTQYDGFTTVLTAVAKLVCGQTYHMKMAIGNVGDNAWDSAVFLRDFKIKPIELEANNSIVPICPGTPISLSSGVDDPNDPSDDNDAFVYQWYADEVLLYSHDDENLSGPTTAPIPVQYLHPGYEYMINTVGEAPNTTDFTLLGAPSNTPGTTFIATGPGTGEGTAIEFSSTTPIPAINLIAGNTYEINTVGPVGYTTNFTLVGAPNNNPGTTFVATGPGTGGGRVFKTVLPVPALNLLPGYTYEISTVGPVGNTTDFTSIGADDNNVGTTFVATGPGTGGGTAVRIVSATAPVPVLYLIPGYSYQINIAGNTDFTLLGAANNNTGTIFIATGPGTGTGNVMYAPEYTFEYYTPFEIPPAWPVTPDCKLATAVYQLSYFTDPFLEPVDIILCTTTSAPYVFGNINQTAAILNGENTGDYDIRYYNNFAQAHAPVPPAGLTAAALSNYSTNNSHENIYIRFENLTSSGCIYIKTFTLDASLAPSGTFSYPNSPYCAQLPLQPITTNVTTGGTYSATPSGLSLDPITGAINPSASTPGNYLVDYFLPASGNCPQYQVDDIPVAITATPVAPAVAGPLTYCEDEVAPALSATGSNLLWYTVSSGGTGTATAPIPNTATAGTTTYWVSQTIGCEGPRASIVVNVDPTPALPSFTAVVPYCQNATATALTATGSNLLWYDSPTDLVGNAIAPVPSTTTAGITSYYVTQTVAGCESARAQIDVETIALPSAPTVVSTVDYCQNATATALTATGSNLLWYDSPSDLVGDAIAPVPSTTTLGATSYYVTQTVNGCEGPRAAITVDVSPIPSTPTFAIVQPTCAVNTATINIATPLGANLEYSINNGTTFQSGTTFAGIPAGVTYDVLVRNNLTQCVSPSAQAVVNPALIIPAAPTAGTTFQPICTTPTGTIEITAPLGANFEYTINGGSSYQAGTTFSGLAPNAAYTLSVRDTTTGCVSTNTVVNVNPIPANPAAPTVAIIQPICTTPTGTVTISTPTGANLEYSINGGTTYQASNVFSGLAPNANYNLTVRDIVTGCISSVTVATVNPIPANPAVPTVTIVQPTCSVNTGSFTISTPIGANLQYSIDGGTNYQSGVTFSGLTAGTTFNPIVKDITTGCVSAPGNVVINPALNVPVAPTMSVTFQPTCTTPTGTIVISAPTGANLSYSINGGTTYQNGTTFAGLAPNATYNVIVKDNVSGCVSTASTAVVNPLPANPPAPTASATVQPICTTPTGTIVITAPTGADFEYSINGGSTYQAGTTFGPLAPNTTYNLTVRNTVTGCISAPTAVVIDPIPANPAMPTGTIVQATCIAPTGTITVTNPVGANLEYSIDAGTTYQTGTSFTALAANATYNIIVRNTATGCVSAPGAFIILPAPTFPATPVASGVDVCVEGTINLTTPTVSGATYSWTGPNGFTSSDQNPTITNADASMAGTYSVVISTTANCPSLPGSVTIAVNPLPLPTLAQDGNICFNVVTNTVLNPYTLTTGLGDTDYDFEWYTEVGGTYNLITGENQSSYVVTVPGNYGVVAINLVTGCESHMVTAPVDMTSPPLALEVVTSEYFADNQTIAINVSPPGVYEYQLDNGAFQSSAVFSNVSAGTHTVKVRNQCDQIEGEAFLMDFPRFFTPNGDGYNDTWNIFALKEQANAKIYIFDRYGKLLKEISPSGKGWDGTFNQNILPSTDYWFSVHYEENLVSKVFKSHFALKR